MSRIDKSARPRLIGPLTVILILVAIAGWSSNPDDAHFIRWVSRQAQQSSGNDLTTTLTPHLVLPALDYERTNYGFFSLVTIHHGNSRTYFLGAFGDWWPVRSTNGG